jgi:glutathione S-transferase
MARPIAFGQRYGINTRSLVIAFEEKSVPYGLAPLPDRDAAGMPLAFPPSSTIPAPALSHDGFIVRGVGAALRYIDEAFPGPRLQPEAARQRARMNQAMEVRQVQAMPVLGRQIWGRYVAAALANDWSPPPLPDDVANAARLCLGALEAPMGAGPFISGDAFTLADAALIPLFACFMPLPDAAALVAESSPLRRWWDTVSARDSVVSTATEGSGHAGLW